MEVPVNRNNCVRKIVWNFEIGRRYYWVFFQCGSELELLIYFVLTGLFYNCVGVEFRRRQWHPTPVLLPGKSHGRRSLVGCNPWGQDWATSLSLFTFMHWRRTWQPTPVFLPGESQGPGKPNGQPSMGSHGVGHDWSVLAAATAGVKFNI